MDRTCGLPAGSVCWNCKHMVVRVINSLDENDDLDYYHHVCILMDIEICDHIVQECSHWKMRNPLEGVG